jgi:hypothetical protein
VIWRTKTVGPTDLNSEPWVLTLLHYRTTCIPYPGPILVTGNNSKCGSRWTSMDDVSITVMSWWTFQQGDVSINVRTKNWRLSSYNRNRQTAYDCDISIPCKPRCTDVEIHRPEFSERFRGHWKHACIVFRSYSVIG